MPFESGFGKWETVEYDKSCINSFGPWSMGAVINLGERILFEARDTFRCLDGSIFAAGPLECSSDNLWILRCIGVVVRKRPEEKRGGCS